MATTEAGRERVVRRIAAPGTTKRGQREHSRGEETWCDGTAAGLVQFAAAPPER
jgi:hypothetical protein